MCQHALIVSRPARTSPTQASSASLARWGAAAACLAGLSYGAAGYLDNPDASGFVAGVVVPVLGVTTPALFLGGLAGLYSWTGSEGSPLRSAALLVGLTGTVLGLFDGLDWWEPDWWSLLFVALTAAGLEMVFWEASRFLGALLFASGVLGWVSLLTDPAFSYVLVPTQQVHVAFAALFCLSCVVWGVALFRVTSQFA
jgi:hypothetical protein